MANDDFMNSNLREDFKYLDATPTQPVKGKRHILR